MKHHQSKDRMIPETTLELNLEYAKFYDYNGKKINPDDYIKMKVYGDSCDLFGIHHNDLVFFLPVYGSETIEFPKICLFKRSDYVVDEVNNKAKYSIARVWMIASETDRIIDINNTLLSSDFKEVMEDSRFPDYDYIYEHINWDFQDLDNTVIISQLDSNNKFILRFRRLSDIIGIAKYSFSLKNRDVK